MQRRARKAMLVRAEVSVQRIAIATAGAMQ
jgi:hypothetical protein